MIESLFLKIVQAKRWQTWYAFLKDISSIGELRWRSDLNRLKNGEFPFPIVWKTRFKKKYLSASSGEKREDWDLYLPWGHLLWYLSEELRKQSNKIQVGGRLGLNINISEFCKWSSLGTWRINTRMEKWHDLSLKRTTVLFYKVVKNSGGSDKKQKGHRHLLLIPLCLKSVRKDCRKERQCILRREEPSYSKAGRWRKLFE